MSAQAPVAAKETPREFAFDAEHFRHISERIYAFAGIRLPEAKREMVYARLARRLRALGIASFDDYVRYLELEPAEWEHCTNALTTNVTSFFREAHHFDILAAHAAESRRAPYRVWSAGCSTGEEPFSIAMCLDEAGLGGAYEVLASDIDTQVLAAAREAIYPLQSVRDLPAERQKRHFLRGTGRFEGRARVRPEIAARVEFLRVNLMEERWPFTGAFDAIFCRNVMIYFDKATQRRLIERFAGLLVPGGLFFAGHAESLLDSGRHFRLRGQTVYALADRGVGGRIP